MLKLFIIENMNLRLPIQKQFNHQYLYIQIWDCKNQLMVYQLMLNNLQKFKSKIQIMRDQKNGMKPYKNIDNNNQNMKMIKKMDLAIKLVVPKMRCLNALMQWQTLISQVEEIFRSNEDAKQKEIAH
ncbi:unnamed protein product [Paramecium sonneborni]|uniref:Uncharacterized protein n=1 Tax=Paramecium sonneborni TaxID=65129 RepID=A0A8S1RVG6_9CILI|nr:unnamed protein product [Paramecium sonneborni]